MLMEHGPIRRGIFPQPQTFPPQGKALLNLYQKTKAHLSYLTVVVQGVVLTSAEQTLQPSQVTRILSIYLQVFRGGSELVLSLLKSRPFCRFKKRRLRTPFFMNQGTLEKIGIRLIKFLLSHLPLDKNIQMVVHFAQRIKPPLVYERANF